MPNISVIIPTLNEAENIDAVLSRTVRSRKRSASSFEVLVVDDGSTDGTAERVQCWERSHPVRLLSRNDERGLASAIRAGARAARGDILVVMDADLSHEPDAIRALVEPIAAGAHDMAIGSRYAPGGKTTGWPLSRRICSRLATLLARPFTGIRDPLSGFFSVRRELLISLPSDLPGFKIALELLASRGGSLRVTEIPIVFHGRKKGKSKLSFSVIAQYFRQLYSFFQVFR